MDRTRSTDRSVSAHRLAVAPLVALGLLALSGCDGSNEPERRPDYRSALSFVQSVTAPDSAGQGTTFDVTIRTFGWNGCWRQGEDHVDRPSSLLVRIEPHDLEYVGHGICTQNLPVFQHLVPVTATQAGELVIEVRTRLHLTTGKDSVGTIERTVTIY